MSGFRETEMSCDKSRGSAALSSRAAMRQRGESPAPEEEDNDGRSETGRGGEGAEVEEEEEEEVQKGSAVSQSVTQTTQDSGPSIFQLHLL